MALTDYTSKSVVKDTLEEQLYRQGGERPMSSPCLTRSSRHQGCQVTQTRGQQMKEQARQQIDPRFDRGPC